MSNLSSVKLRQKSSYSCLLQRFHRCNPFVRPPSRKPLSHTGPRSVGRLTWGSGDLSPHLMRETCHSLKFISMASNPEGTTLWTRSTEKVFRSELTMVDRVDFHRIKSHSTRQDLYLLSSLSVFRYVFHLSIGRFNKREVIRKLGNLK